MYAYEEKKQPSILKLILTVAIFIVLAMYGIISLSTGDPLWFYTTFDAQPETITVYCYGQETVLTPGSQDFDQLTAIFNENFSGYKNWDSLSMSEDTWNYYQTSDAMMLIIFSYPQQLRVHSTYKYFSSVDTLVIPLDGRHAKTNAVFGMTNDIPASGAMHMMDKSPLSKYLSEHALCTPSVTASN